MAKIQHLKNIDPSAESERPIGGVLAAGIGLLVAFTVLFFISGPFEYGSPEARPILAVAGALLAAAAVATWGLVQAGRLKRSRSRELLLIVFAFAISTRLVALFTCPILEIDYYRYLWDGKVVAAGVSPYRYSPAQILQPERNSDAGDVELQRLRALVGRSPSNFTVLDRVHFKNYTSVYPPVSQFVFALTMRWFPESASVDAHIVAIKSSLLVFDLMTMVLICRLLTVCGLHPSWLIVYAWNPLVIKEIANGGHLDSIATFLAVLSLLAVVQWFYTGRKTSWGGVAVGGVSLALGVGAKLFPVVLFPALLVAVFKRSRLAAGVFLVTFIVTMALVMMPVLNARLAKREREIDQPSVASDAQAGLRNSDPAVEGHGQVADQTQDGFEGFFSSWRMNDPVFSTVYLNLGSSRPDTARRWFVFSTRQWRIDFKNWWQSRGFGGSNPAFHATRMMTLAVFAIFYLYQLLVIFRTKLDSGFDGAGFIARLGMIIAFFLVMQPTVNPWYFVWVAPLVCFSKNKGWLIVSGVLSLYYSRFWFQSFSGTYNVAGVDYSGSGLFDHIVVFVEFGTIAGTLIYFCSRKSKNAAGSQAIGDTGGR